ncbi:MAG: hypothetical protein JWN52_4470 [Actinomycetia bacterium]|nr:hypothetical protein [Actinomycetes bacterium]
MTACLQDALLCRWVAAGLVVDQFQRSRKVSRPAAKPLPQPETAATPLEREAKQEIEGLLAALIEACGDTDGAHAWGLRDKAEAVYQRLSFSDKKRVGDSLATHDRWLKRIPRPEPKLHQLTGLGTGSASQHPSGTSTAGERKVTRFIELAQDALLKSDLGRARAFTRQASLLLPSVSAENQGPIRQRLRALDIEIHTRSSRSAWYELP